MSSQTMRERERERERGGERGEREREKQGRDAFNVNCLIFPNLRDVYRYLPYTRVAGIC